MTSHIDDTPSENYSSYKEQFKELKQTPEEKLLNQLETQLRAVQGKGSPGGKHEQKATVLQAAIDVLKNNGSVEDLRTTMEKNPRYNESFGKSTTEALIDKTIEMAERNNYGMTH